MRLAARPPCDVVSRLSMFSAMRRSTDKFCAALPCLTLLSSSESYVQHPVDRVLDPPMRSEASSTWADSICRNGHLTILNPPDSTMAVRPLRSFISLVPDARFCHDRLMEVVVEIVKTGLSGLFKRIRYVLVELGLVLLEGQDVVSALVDNRRRYIFLTPHRVDGHCAS